VRVSVPFASSFPDARLAQLVERRPYKANVGGSIPSARTISNQSVRPLPQKAPGPSAGVHHWAALPSGVNVSGHEVNNAERGPSHANHQNDNVPGTHTHPFRSKIGRTSVQRMIGGASSTRNQSTGECGRLILGYCTRGLSVVTPPVGA
jgi:hypothetical protein